MILLLPIFSLGFAILLQEQDQEPQKLEGFGALPPSATPSATSVLKSAGLAGGGWTGRNVLQAGAADSYSRRLAGTATEADFAVIRAARPGIASGQAGHISSVWTGSPWPGASGPGSEIDIDAFSDDIGDQVLSEMGL